MVYVRGHPEDFNTWQQMGALGWGYDDVLPYFKKAQGFVGATPDDAFRGASGPLRVTDGVMTNPLYQAFLRAAEQAGHSLRDDLNDDQQEGFGPLPMTVADGIRASTGEVYLWPVRRRRNLTVLTGRQVAKIRFDENKKANGVELVGSESPVGARREVILCAGAIQSPHLLQLSGVGPGDLLQRLGIDVIADRGSVGANLMDHLEVYVQHACTQPVSLLRHLGPVGRVRLGLQWLLRRDGLGATNHFEAGGFIRSHERVAYPDIQFHFLPMAMTYDGRVQATEHGYQVHVGPMRSASRGHVHLRDAQPLRAPSIDFNYMAHDQDWLEFRAAIRAAREIFAQDAFGPLQGPELQPGPAQVSDDDLDDFVRANAESAYHPCGTCRMGSDAEAVVDPEGRVQGVAGLRVVDASIFPQITNGNLNAPTIMAAEKLADAILQEP